MNRNGRFNGRRAIEGNRFTAKPFPRMDKMRDQSDSPPSGKIVALVEDEPFVRDLAASELEDNGFKVVEFDSADTALPWLRAHGNEVSVMITDVQMPGSMNGLQLVDVMFRLWPHLAMLVTSGGPLVDPSMLPPSARFVAKPWRPVDLAARVQRMAMSHAF